MMLAQPFSHCIAIMPVRVPLWVMEAWIDHWQSTGVSKKTANYPSAIRIYCPNLQWHFLQHLLQHPNQPHQNVLQICLQLPPQDCLQLSKPQKSILLGCWNPHRINLVFSGSIMQFASQTMTSMRIYHMMTWWIHPPICSLAIQLTLITYIRLIKIAGHPSFQPEDVAGTNWQLVDAQLSGDRECHHSNGEYWEDEEGDNGDWSKPQSRSRSHSTNGCCIQD